MAKKQPDITSGLTWLGTILQYIKDYGVCNILKALIIMFILSITLRICYNPAFLFDKYSDYMAQKHTQELVNRINDDKKVKDLLPKLLYRSNADRVWIIQYHNGISDWLYGSMRFELCGEGIHPIKEQYDNFHLSWLMLPDYLKTHTTFIGNLATLEPLDHVLYDRFRKNGIEYLACILLKDDIGTPTGILGFTWENMNNIEYEESEIKENLIRYGAIIGQYIKPNVINNAKVK